jgi:hypothetical protein
MLVPANMLLETPTYWMSWLMSNVHLPFSGKALIPHTRQVNTTYNENGILSSILNKLSAQA